MNIDRETQEAAEFPSNSNKDKNKKIEVAESKVKKVVTGKVITRKKGLGKKFAELFMGEGSDMNSVISYVIKDVLIPDATSMLYNMLTGGLEMKFFGTSGGKSRRNSGGNGRKTYSTSYSDFSKTSSRDRDRRDRDRDYEDDRRSVASSYDDVVMITKGDAEEVLSNLADLVEDYGVASVADFYGFIGIPGKFTDNKYGWDDLRGVKVVRVRDGYILNLPKTRIIN